MSLIKIKKLLLFILVNFCLPSSVLAGNLVLKSFGHSSFLIKNDAISILINPFKALGCTSKLKEPQGINADLILASSKLTDEGYNPNDKLMFVESGIYKYKDILFNGITVPHDRVEGRRFGMATVWSWEQSNLKIVHMGGAAGKMDTDSRIVLARPDILFISIGGGIKSYNGEEASRIVKKLKPSVVIPVHFEKRKQKNEECDFSNEDLFLQNMQDFKVKYLGKDLKIKSRRINENTIYIFRD